MKQVNNSKLHLYADDTVLYFSHKSVDIVEKILISLNVKYKAGFAGFNKLSFYVDKTICMLFGTGAMLSKCNILNVNICGKRIVQINTVKYLGMHLDTKLKWDIHIDEMCKKK